jgi:hypothetical protein
VRAPVHARGPYFGGCIALKSAIKTLGLHGVIIRSKGRKYVMADSAFKRMQVDACACWLDTGKHHRGVALRTSRALNCHEWNDGRQGVRLGHDASLKQAGAQHSLSPEMPGRRSGDCQNVRRQGSQTRVNSRTDGRKVSKHQPILRGRRFMPAGFLPHRSRASLRRRQCFSLRDGSNARSTCRFRARICRSEQTWWVRRDWRRA